MQTILQLAKTALDYGAGKAGIPIVGAALTMYDVIDSVVSDAEEKDLEKLKKALGCTCLAIVSRDWAPPTIRCLQKVATMQHGCAFVINGSAVYHPQTNLDVKTVATDVLRWNRKTGKVDLDRASVGGTEKCSNCTGK
jgi:hypothetical protein